MARSKLTPERSQLARRGTTAFAKRQRTTEAGEVGDDDDDKKAEAKTEAKADAKPGANASDQPAEPAAAEARGPAPEAPKELPAIEPPPPKGEPWPDATPEPMKPVDPPRARTETMLMPTLAELGKPPEMPTSSAPPPLALGAVESPTHMPGPRDIPSGDPDDPAPAPGAVPPGDSRSLRHERSFALVYRLGTFVISRFGVVGTRGQWRVVEYPTSSAASHAYAKECSRFVSEGFSDYRE